VGSRNGTDEPGAWTKPRQDRSYGQFNKQPMSGCLPDWLPTSGPTGTYRGPTLATTSEATMDKEQIHAELDRVRNDFRELLDTATVAELRKRTEGTKWNNEQLLFHMLFGYLLVRNLRFLVWGFSRLPDNVSRRFAALLNAGTRPFHVINYVGSLFGARVLGYARMERLMDRVLSSLQASLRGESETALDRGMHFPIGWDPYFRDYMTLRDVYHYPTQHYDHHRRQLTLASARGQ
jgi:hypothetical protein